MIKWYTITEWVDQETGEIIEEKEKHKYIITKKELKYETTETHGIRKYTNICKKNPQTRLFD